MWATFFLSSQMVFFPCCLSLSPLFLSHNKKSLVFIKWATIWKFLSPTFKMKPTMLGTFFDTSHLVEGFGQRRCFTTFSYLEQGAKCRYFWLGVEIETHEKWEEYTPSSSFSLYFPNEKVFCAKKWLVEVIMTFCKKNARIETFWQIPFSLMWRRFVIGHNWFHNFLKCHGPLRHVFSQK